MKWKLGQSVNSRAAQAGEESAKRTTRPQKLPSPGGREWESEESPRDHWKPSGEAAYELLGSQEKRKRRGRKLIYRKNGWGRPKSGRDLDIHVHEAHCSPHKLNLRGSSLRHSIIKLSKIKDKERKAAYNFQLSHKAISRFISKNLTGQERVGQNVQRACRKNCQPRTLYPAELSFRNEGETETSQTSKSWGSSSPLDLPHKKCWKEFFRMLISNMKT